MDQLQSQALFDGDFISVARRRVRRAGGEQVEREVVEHPGSVGIVAHDEEWVYLVRQPREAVDEDALLEIPAGTLDVEGETELECAKRELAEEVGLGAATWTKLQAIYASPGYLSEKLTIFEATELSAQPREADEGEAIEVVRLPLTELDSALLEIEDAKTLVALFLLRDRLTLDSLPG
jgi:8-oxo-dGTP pyrophosphatase MutT (NUDIX family)